MQSEVLRRSIVGEETRMTEHKRRPPSLDHGGLTYNAGKRHKSSSEMCLSSKERKEKVGERITALQQLVSPFGKTDTASVLSEAMEYIKFLHDQVKVLSAPYLLNGTAGTFPRNIAYEAEDFVLFQCRALSELLEAMARISGLRSKAAAPRLSSDSPFAPDVFNSQSSNASSV